MVSDAIPLDAAMTLVWYEADLLDSGGYDEWLALWTPEARYIVPIVPETTDFENTLNYAFDDDAMRRKRVARLLSGQSVSTTPVARTVRLISRFRLLESTPEACVLRCAQLLTEFRLGTERLYAADLEYQLVRMPAGLRIARKVIRLINATESLGGIGYIL